MESIGTTGLSSIAAQTSASVASIDCARRQAKVVQVSNKLAGGWMPLQSVSLTNGSFYFSDPQWTNYPGRFYRIRSP